MGQDEDADLWRKWAPGLLKKLKMPMPSKAFPEEREVPQSRIDELEKQKQKVLRESEISDKNHE